MHANKKIENGKESFICDITSNTNITRNSMDIPNIMDRKKSEYDKEVDNVSIKKKSYINHNMQRENTREDPSNNMDYTNKSTSDSNDIENENKMERCTNILGLDKRETVIKINDINKDNKHTNGIKCEDKRKSTSIHMEDINNSTNYLNNKEYNSKGENNNNILGDDKRESTFKIYDIQKSEYNSNDLQYDNKRERTSINLANGAKNNVDINNYINVDDTKERISINLDNVAQK
ncbi:hypothetical protein PFDG_05116 [Plasmodium falciparum Dd2]|uniref:Uncharacterized protein n=1 Tax=Plasmodium falciparum (isolate Dd2) TaxID=57267 RepID=A0A0L7M9N5_PLAF4|nr:hypothetical protein PFDG_05116 [Plasmodium falciparum Dd2]